MRQERILVKRRKIKARGGVNGGAGKSRKGRGGEGHNDPSRIRREISLPNSGGAESLDRNTTKMKRTNLKRFIVKEPKNPRGSPKVERKGKSKREKEHMEIDGETTKR